MRSLLVLCALLCAPSIGSAQARQPPAIPSPAAPESAGGLMPGASVWTLTGGNAWGVELLHSEPGHNYSVSSLSWGRVLSGLKGRGALRGQFVWAVEVMPLFVQRDPDALHGVGVSPIVWRWDFVPRGRWWATAEIAGGLLGTSRPIPLETTTFNWTAHAGFSVRLMVTGTQGLIVGYRFHHISNGNRLERNPGVNAHIAQIGWAVVRR